MQNYVLRRRQPECFPKPLIFNLSAEHFTLEGDLPQQPEIRLKSGGHMDDIELMRRLIGGANRCLINEIVWTGERCDECRDFARRQLYHKIQIMSGPRDP